MLAKRDGFSLIELIVVLVIIGIIIAISSLNFSQMNRKSQIEKQTRELFTDVNAARTESMFRKKRHAIVINTAATGYTFKRYSSANESLANGEIITSKSTVYTMSDVAGGTIVNEVLAFDTTGIAYNFDGDVIDGANPVIIRFEPINSGAVFDCVDIRATSTNLGRLNSGACVPQ